VGGLHGEADGIQVVDDGPAGVLAPVDGGQVEVAAAVVRQGGGLAVLAAHEQEELRLGSGVHDKAQLLGPIAGALQRLPRAAGERGFVRVVDVADQPGHLAGDLLPGVEHIGVQVGLEQHVRLLDAGEALYRRSIEHDLSVDGLLEFALGHFHVLDDAHDVGELQAQKAHLVLFQFF
jgi:hypothetical protein